MPTYVQIVPTQLMLFIENETSYSKQGNAGVGFAIAYFTKIGYTVSIPLTDTQDYDLVVDNGENLLKIQIKTTGSKSRHGIYSLNLRVTGGNRSGVGKSKTFDQNHCDAVFAVTNEGSMYYIPRNVIKAKTTINLGKIYEKYKVNLL